MFLCYYPLFQPVSHAPCLSPTPTLSPSLFLVPSNGLQFCLGIFEVGTLFQAFIVTVCISHYSTYPRPGALVWFLPPSLRQITVPYCSFRQTLLCFQVISSSFAFAHIPFSVGPVAIDCVSSDLPTPCPLPSTCSSQLPSFPLFVQDTRSNTFPHPWCVPMHLPCHCVPCPATCLPPPFCALCLPTHWDICPQTGTTPFGVDGGKEHLRQEWGR